MAAVPLTVERTNATVVTVRIPFGGKNTEQWFLLRSDAHHDNLYCDQGLEKKHLEEAKARKAGILDFGDLFCAMQGRFDKRLDYDQLRPELRVGSKTYLDTLVHHAAEFYGPYAANWVLLSAGNHETALLNRHQTNLTERLAERLKAGKSPVQVGTYQGWVRFMFDWPHSSRCLRLRYTHGYAGGGQVTRDIIQTNRQLVYIGNADFLVSGHTHDAWNVPIRREILDQYGTPILQDVECIKCGGYKDEYSPSKGWAAEKGMAPRPLGAYWIRFYVEASHNKVVSYDVQRAK